MNTFEDVKEGKYYYDAVLWAVNHDPQITAGLTPTSFGPNKSCTREQIVTFLWNAFGRPEHHQTENPFSDVKENKYQLVENKQKFIGQIMTSKSPVRSAEDIDEQALSYA